MAKKPKKGPLARKGQSKAQVMKRPRTPGGGVSRLAGTARGGGDIPLDPPIRRKGSAETGTGSAGTV